MAHTNANGPVHPAVAPYATFVIICGATSAKATKISPTIMVFFIVIPEYGTEIYKAIL